MKSLFTFFIFLFVQIGFAQQNKSLPIYSHIFAADSLAGFEEAAAKNSAISEGFLGEEFKVRMWGLKRAYINAKYRLTLAKPSQPTIQYREIMITPGCVNEDFESSASGTITSMNQITGWTIVSGQNIMPSNSCNLNGCCPNPPAESAIINCSASGFIDPIIGSVYPIYSVFGTVTNTGTSVNSGLSQMFGNKVIRLNNYIGDYSIEKLTKTILITPSNAFFQVAFIGVFFGGHSCCDGESFQIKLTNAMTSMPIACPGVSVSPLATSCSPTSLINFYNTGSGTPATSSSFGTVFNKWQKTSLDLSPYIGQTITIDIIASDCTGGSHYGYAYVDAQCGTMTYQNSNVSTVSAASTSVTLASCGLVSFSITAPPGLGPYSWAGPAVGPPYTTPSMSNQTFTTNVAGTVTLTMNPVGACFPLNKVITLSITPGASPLSITGNTNICMNANTSFTVSGANTYTWSNGSNSNVTTVSPSSATMYTVTSLDANNCYNSDSVYVTVNPLPTLTITGVNTVCIGSSTNFTLSGANTYSLNSLPVTNTINILPTVNTTYSVSGTSTINCVNTQTVSVTVNTTCADVWPGDANSDGIADNLDVLELGLHYTQTGPLRTPTSNLWQSYFANNWTGLISSGGNLNHSDCNGDGVIDQNDTLAIFNNYNFTHTFRNNAVAAINPQLTITADQSFVQSGQWGTASIYLGDISNPINNINGAAFTVNFDKNHLQFDSVYIEYPVSFLNAANHNLHFRKKQFNNGFVYAATTHTNNSNVSGNGKIAIFHFKVNPAMGFDTLFTVSLANANQSNANGAITLLTISPNSTVQIGNTVGIKENLNSDNNISIYPNPTNGSITIKDTKEIQKVEVTNIAGQTLMSEFGKGKTQQVNLNGFAEGIYFVKIYSVDNSVAWKKIVLKN